MRLLCFFCFVMAATAQDARLTWRLQVQIVTSNSADALTFRTNIVTRIRAQDLDDVERKGSPAEVRQNEPGGGHRINGVFIFRDEASATNALAQLRTLKTPALSGRVSLHLCPKEGTIRDWGGCDQDARAKYREERF